MRVALTYNEKPSSVPAGVPDDAFEEFDSPATIDAIAGALESLGHEVRPMLADATLPAAFTNHRPQLVFNMAEGFRGRCRESLVPALCELMEIPYTGSDPLTLAVTLDKAVAKKLLHPEIDTPRWFLLESLADLSRVEGPYPLIVKPNCEGSSKGVRRASKVDDAGELAHQVRWTFESYGGPVLVEEFIAGPEVTVGVLQGPEVIGTMEIVPRQVEAEQFIYSLEVKRDWQRQVEYRVPPRLPADVVARSSRAAARAFELLGCRDVSRFDFRIDRDGRVLFLECNPLPGLNPVNSDIVILSRASGLPYNSLVQRIVDSALRRHGLS